MIAGEHVSVFVHVFAPAESKVTRALKQGIGSISGVVDADVDGSTMRVATWTTVDERARQERWIRRIFDEDEFGRRAPWPCAAFSTSDLLPDPLVLSFHPPETEIVSIGDEPGLWIHFVGEDQETCQLLPKVYSSPLDTAVRDGIWGIEEGYYEAGELPGGWWVTPGREPGAIPRERHSIC